MIYCLIHNKQHSYINDIPLVNDSFFRVWAFQWIKWTGSQNQPEWFVHKPDWISPNRSLVNTRSLSDIFDLQLSLIVWFIICSISYINDIPPVTTHSLSLTFEWISWIGSQNQSLVWFVMSRFIIGDEQHAYISEIPFVNDSFFWVRWINRTGSQNQLEWFFTNQNESIQAVL